MKTLLAEQLYVYHNQLTIIMVVVWVLFSYLGLTIKSGRLKKNISYADETSSDEEIVFPILGTATAARIPNTTMIMTSSIRVKPSLNIFFISLFQPYPLIMS